MVALLLGMAGACCGSPRRYMGLGMARGDTGLGMAKGPRGGPMVTSRPRAGVGRDGAHGPDPGGREQPLQPEPALLR